MNLLKLFKKKERVKFDRKILRKNDISLLIVDERWNSLFTAEKKTTEIISHEEKLRHLLKEQARVGTEQKEIAGTKKTCMDRIMQLTETAYEDNNTEALGEMQHCQDEINRINERTTTIQQELEEITDKIQDANLALLEATVNAVYWKMQSRRQKIEELVQETDLLKKKLRQCSSEKQELDERVTHVYSYFHDLLGREELERLDREYMI